MGRINTVPVGLQDLLGNTNFGDNPSDLSGITAPSLDLFPFLASQKVNYAFGIGTFTARGDEYYIDIPDGQYWMPLCFSVQVFGAGASGQRHGFNLNVQNVDFPLGQIEQPIFSLYDRTMVIAGDFPAATFWVPEKVIFGPGTRFKTECTLFTAAVAYSMRTEVMYYRFRG